MKSVVKPSKSSYCCPTIETIGLRIRSIVLVPIAFIGLEGNERSLVSPSEL